ncbi:M24 family metallopeptidase [Mycoplasmatota bacterium zrk1]
MNKKHVINLQDQFELRDKLLKHRLEKLLPELMKETNTDMWIVIGDEYNEGPTIRSLLPSSFFHARRKAIFIFVYQDNELKRYIVSKPDFTIANFYTPILLKPPLFDFEMFYSTFQSGYDLDMIRSLPVEDEKACIKRIVNESNPEKISIDVSTLTPFSDGLSKTNYDFLLDCIDNIHHDKISSGENIALRWLETRTELELDVVKSIVKLTREIILECYSRKVITPSKTTLGQARFFLMERAMELCGIPWFSATVWIRRNGHPHLDSDSEVIKKGDLLHCDFGFEYAGLCSDVQEMAYVKGENDEQLIKELEGIHNIAMDLQNILADSFKFGMTGNEILQNALTVAKEKGIKRPMIYTHPIGLFGHGPGPTIGSFTNQEFVKGMGEYKLFDNTLYAMELNIREEVPSWNNQIIMYGQEIEVAFINNKVEFLGGRQQKLHIIY